MAETVAVKGNGQGMPPITASPSQPTAQVQGSAPVPGKRYFLFDEDLFQAVVNNFGEQKFKEVATLFSRIQGVSVIVFPPPPAPDA